MSQTKAQLIQPIGVVTASGVVVSGVMTAATFDGDIVGSATSIIQGTNLNLGAFNASSFAGDFTGNATGIITSSAIKVGQLTASSFVGDFTGTATSMMRGTGFEAGAVTGSSFVADVTGNVTGNATGLAGSVTQGTNIHVGVVTATSLYGDGSNLTGIAATNFNTQTVAAVGAATTIDLSAGNIITFNQNVNTTVSFANTSEAMDITLIRPGGNRTVAVSYATGGVDFDGTGDYLEVPSSSDLTFGTGDFCVEFQAYPDNFTNRGTFYDTRPSGSTTGITIGHESSSGEVRVYINATSGSDIVVQSSDFNTGEWQHVAVTRTSGTVRLFINGTLKDSATDTTDINNTNAVNIGYKTYTSSGYTYFDGKISNFRVVKGSSVYTTNFNPPSADLTNITNTKLLCCQSTSSTTTAAVTPGTITANGDPTAGAQTISLASASRPTQGTITWPSGVRWNGSGVAPRTGHANEDEVDQFQMLTRDSGVTWYAWEPMDIDYKFKYEAYTFGDDESGMLGQNTDNIKKSSPTQIGGSWIDAAASGRTWLLSKPGGSLWAVGFNPAGQLGQNDTVTRSSPIQIGRDTNWSLYNKGGSGTCSLATKTDGTLWVWGKNDQGCIGQNQAEAQKEGISSPIQIPGTYRTTRGGIADTRATNCAVVGADGTLWTWGSNEFGELGQNNKTQYSSPCQVPGTTWASVFGGQDSMYALKTNGSAWAWGRNNSGVLGLSNTTNYSSPVQLPGTWFRIGKVGSVAAGIKFSWAGAKIGTGSLWTWGMNSYGQLGHNNTTNYSSPKQVGSEETWNLVQGSWASAIATKTDGSLWAWGYNDDSTGAGNLGQNNTIEYSSPVQIPGTDWKYAYGAYGAMWAMKGDNRAWTPRPLVNQSPMGLDLP